MVTEQEHGAIVWKNGKLVPWQEATIHVMSHVVNYGSSVFEGIRCYDTKRGSAIFRLDSHIERLMNSAHIYRMQVPFTYEEITDACRQLVLANEYKACYLRPIIVRGYGTFGVDPFPCPIDTYICTWQWGKYLGPEALEQGVAGVLFGPEHGQAARVEVARHLTTRLFDRACDLLRNRVKLLDLRLNVRALEFAHRDEHAVLGLRLVDLLAEQLVGFFQFRHQERLLRIRDDDRRAQRE